jgi:osmotically-inducible protein OsmY
MINKLTAAIFVAGLAVAPAASYANGTMSTKADAANASSTATPNHPGMTNHATKTGEALSDAAITTKVKARFATDKLVSATNIHVDTDNGVVKLSGTAKNQGEAMKAADIAKSTDGVTSVDNAIKVGTAGTKY